MAKAPLDLADAERIRELHLIVFPLQTPDIHKRQTPLIWATKSTDQNRIFFFNYGSGERCGRLEAPIVTKHRGSMRLEDTKLIITFS